MKLSFHKQNRRPQLGRYAHGEMKDDLRISFHYGLVFIIFLGITSSVSYVVSKLGIFAYPVAYFLAFYLPTFLWILMMNPSKHEVRFTEDGISRGVAAVLILLSLQAILFGMDWMGLRDDGGSPRHTFLNFFFPIFLGFEFILLAIRIKKNVDSTSVS